MSNAEKIAEEVMSYIDTGNKPPEDVNDLFKELRDEIRGYMQAHTNQTLDKLKKEVEEREKKLDEKISSLKLSANPDDWILANGIEQVKMGVHSVIALIDEVSNE